MPFVTFLTGLLVAGAVVVVGSALVVVWAVAYGSGRYCRQQIQNSGSKPPSTKAWQVRQRVS
ncbi:MAG: hypothetical protein C7B44_15375 [Sulfobacillus thermosulfidooxidans]|uniref:Uncharacterized protein n=1 Tax=Sulfobacillus thermotolerans TaxID=338644 RepID=A0ABN5GY93_9FIRM|nr:hypothetical protein [Sulfobacillus sp. hq2]AUW93346.1 hypothetical protein BXT84_04740 [Sulfobacillus thermotolerans]MCY0909125.1 hypothetical protein [Sulfobacillus thermotolerans]POB10579.1 hypothetical protein CO251_06985 [Sulfobacillus sp. hq2]PSR32415.1 MAG: hypothetical protein C7B44_15375 [Sulfobacillus thermosulfidooxidans]